MLETNISDEEVNVTSPIESISSQPTAPKYAKPFPPKWKPKSGGINPARAYKWLNERHFVVVSAGKTWVANIPRNEDEDLTFSSFDDFKKRYLNWYVEILTDDGIDKFYPAEPWLSTENRRQHTAVVLDPRRAHLTDPYAFNLWQGFGVPPLPGEWGEIAWHLLHVVCGGNERNFEWLLRWMAYCVQFPERQAEVAIVLRGLKGTGKGLTAKILKRIFGRHTFHVSSPDHFISRFNGHLMKALFLFVDEGFWSGDKKNEGRMKALITEGEIAFEGKYQPVVMMPNRLKIMMASNEEWVVPATADERRFFVLDVSDRCKGAPAYFGRLAAAIEGVELSCFLDHLQKMDLSRFDHRNPPHTESLNEQKLKSLSGFDRFWFDLLVNGMTPGGSCWESRIPCTLLQKEYRDNARGFSLSNAAIGTRLHELAPGVAHTRPRVGKMRQPYYKLPPLEECRAGFLKAMRIESYDWEQEKPEHIVVGQKPAPKLSGVG